jgi:hypothetical protein
VAAILAQKQAVGLSQLDTDSTYDRANAKLTAPINAIVTKLIKGG